MTAIIEQRPEVWDAQYREGSWEHLKGHVAHYAVVAAMVRNLKAQYVLDVGCGEGLLWAYLPTGAVIFRIKSI